MRVHLAPLGMTSQMEEWEKGVITGISVDTRGARAPLRLLNDDDY